MKTWIVLLAVAFLPCFAFAQGAKVSIKDAGAVGDGKTLDSAAVQKAIDDVHGKGGGVVTVPPGKYLCGTIVLKDNITLHLDEGAEILGTTDLSQYKNLDPFKDGLGADVGTAFVVAVDAKNITIEGKGTFNGNGEAIAKAKGFKGEGWGFRPMLLRLVRCKDVTVRDVTFRDSASWTTNYFGCKGVKIENVKIDSHVAPHNDGINIDGCEDFTVTNCDVDSGDDALVLKSTSGQLCKNITATGCKLKSRQGAIKLGTESFGGFEKIRISNCQIRDTRNGGIKILCVDGGSLSDVVISDITMENVRTPIFVRRGARLKTFRQGETQKTTAGPLKNVVIRNVKAKSAQETQLKPPSGIFITGITNYPIEDFTLENIEIELPGSGEAAHARAVVEEKIDTYPEINRFGPGLPASGAYVRHVKGLKMNNVTFKLASKDLRPILVCSDVQDATFSDWNVSANAEAEALVRLEATKNATLKNFKIDGSAGTFVRAEGESAGIKLETNQLDAAKQPFEVAAGAPADAVKNQ